MNNENHHRRLVSEHRCPCGQTYDRATWHNLPLVGVIRDREETLELRNCVCGSTRAEPLPQMYALTRAERIAARSVRATVRLQRALEKGAPMSALFRIAQWTVGWHRAAARAGVA